MVTPDDIQDAALCMSGHILRTPLVYSPTFSELTGANVYLKLENLQKSGSFKVRGASYRILSMGNRIGRNGVVAASAGNHAQGVALAAREAGVPSTIVMPESVSPGKEEAVRHYGSHVIIYGATLEESIGYAGEFERDDMTFIHPYDDPYVIAGQGTVGLEIAEDLPGTDLIIVPVGGGVLISGIAVAARGFLPGARIIGVESLSCPAGSRAFAAGKPVSVAVKPSIADGILVRKIGPLPFDIMHNSVESIVPVSEDLISLAMLRLLERKKVLVEGAGAVPLAALMSGLITVEEGSNVVLVISGGNVDVPLFKRILRQDLIRTGRIMQFSAFLNDRPGALASLLSCVADRRGNVLHIRHTRSGRDHPLHMMQVYLELETRGPMHIKEIRDALDAAGFRVFDQ